jgi:hypothetical protein
MISLTPGTTPQETAAAFVILALIADPAAAKKRLDELVAEKNAAIQAAADAKAATEATTAAQAKAAGDIAEVSKLRDLQTQERAAIDAKVKDLEAREAALAKEIAAHRDEVDAKKADFETREAALSAMKRAIIQKLPGL